MKKVIKGIILQNVIDESLSLLCDTVSSSLGPKGNNSIISSSDFPAFITNDGVTIARNIESDDLAINAVLDILKEASIKTDDEVGDGTTTTLVLLKAIMDYAKKMMVDGLSKYEIKNKIVSEEEKIIMMIKNESFKPSLKDLKNIARTSAKEREIGDIIYEVVSKIKNISGVSINVGNREETNVFYFKGYEFDTNMASPYFFKDKDNLVLNNPYVLISEDVLENIEDISTLVNKAYNDKRDVFILASDYNPDFVNQVLSYNYETDLKIYLLKNPEFGKRQYILIKDLLNICSSSVFKNNFNYGNVGNTQKIVIDKDKTHFYFEKNMESYIKETQLEIEKLKDEFEIDYQNRRISMLSDGLAKVEVGGKTLSEAREKKMHFDDALHATYSALTGVNVGGSFTYLKVAYSLEDENIFKYVLFEPFKKILLNAGLDWKNIYDEIVKDFKKVYNAKTCEFENIDETSIIDSTEVLIQSIKTAVSIANLLLSIDSLVINEKIKNIDINEVNI